MSRLIALMYHRVLEEGDPTRPNPSSISATPAAFAEHVKHLARRYRVVSLHDVLDALRGGRPLPDPAVLITFDDAYRDFGDVAWPILRRHGLPAAVFVPTAFADHPGRVFWWDRLARALVPPGHAVELELPWGRARVESAEQRRATLRALQAHVKQLPPDAADAAVSSVLSQIPAPAEPDGVSLVLGWRELRELARDGVTVCAHTRTHPALSRAPLAHAAEEIRGSMEDVRREIGECPPVFAYPFGDHDPAVVELARREGIEAAFTTREGSSRVPGADALRLCRTSVSLKGARLLPLRLRPWGERLDVWRRARRARAIPARERPRGTSASGAPAATSRDGRSAPVAYVMSRFPKLTETFVLYELAALEAMGVPVEVFPLLRTRQAVSHPEADAWRRRARFRPLFSLDVLEAQLHFIRESPTRYAGTLLDVLRRTWGSGNFFIGAIGTFPKAVRFALDMSELGVRHVHAHFANHPTVAAYVVNRLTGIPFSFTAHGHDLHVERRMLDAKVAASAFTVTVSQYNRALIEDICGEGACGKVHVVHCGVDPEVFGGSGERAARTGTSTRMREDTAATPFTVMCVASFEEVKGHRYLVDALRILAERGVDTCCHLIGEGPLRRDIEALASRSGLRGRVVFHGPLPRHQVARLLALADAAVLASHRTRDGKREGIPVALMEAMAVGLPVVASNLSGIPELVEDGRTGLLVPPKDAGAIADALARLAACADLRERLGSAGRRKVREEFDLGRNARRLLSLMMGGPDARWTERTPAAPPPEDASAAPSLRPTPTPAAAPPGRLPPAP